MVVLSKRPPAPVTGSTVSRLGKALAVGGLVLVLSVALLGWLALIDSGPLDLEQISFAPEAFVELIRGWGAWGVAGSLALMVLHSFVPFPAECLALANGMVFGLFWGSLITWSGAMLGAWLAFGLARTLGRPFVGRVLPARHRERIDAWSGDHGWSALLAARLVPVIAFNLINYAAGLVRVSDQLRGRAGARLMVDVHLDHRGGDPAADRADGAARRAHGDHARLGLGWPGALRVRPVATVAPIPEGGDPGDRVRFRGRRLSVISAAVVGRDHSAGVVFVGVDAPRSGRLRRRVDVDLVVGPTDHPIRLAEAEAGRA
jgi:uncharacterized membrane protein YdjX (TVP38/TMEM64 family)